jgi:predicted RND superfamily exporter protein
MQSPAQTQRHSIAAAVEGDIARGRGRGTGPLQRPWAVLGACLLAIIIAGAGLRGVVKDPSVDAFVPLDHPAALARDAARARFGLEDPLIVGLAGPAGKSLFTIDALEALRRIHEVVRTVPGVQKNDVISLASEKAIAGSDGDLLVDPIIEAGPVTADTAALAASRFAAMPVLHNLLASRSGDALIVIVPVDDPNHATEVYDRVRALAEAEAPAGLSVHVAGVAGMNARLAQTVDSDTRIFVPAAFLVVLVLLLIALRQPRALLGPLFVIAASAAVAIGTMGWMDARYYLISTALPVVIMAMAVADSLHVILYYLRTRAELPTLTAFDAVTATLRDIWVPVTLTSVTTVAGLLGLAFGTAMRPISEFGIFAAIGVAAAWVLSLTALPAILILTNLKPAPARPGRASLRTPWLEAKIHRLGQWSIARPVPGITLLLLLTAPLLAAALHAQFDYERQRYFAAADPVKLADQLLGERLGGFNFLDVAVTAPAPGGLMDTAALAAIADLKRSIATLPEVTKVAAIDDYVSLMHQALTGAAPGALPQDPGAPAQYMFLYESSAEPDDFRQRIDYDHQHALLRAQLATDRYSATQPAVHALDALLTDWQAQSGLAAVVSGRIAVNEGWMSVLAQNHFRGLGLAVLLVFVVTAIAMRGFGPALLAMLPVGGGILFIYAIMGAFRIDIAPATSMSAAIATGLGVDFGIHLIAYLRKRLAAGASLTEALDERFALVARACFYSALALGVALAVICLSSAPPLRWFGVLVGAGAIGSLLGALLLIPAVLSLTGTALLGRARGTHV